MQEKPSSWQMTVGGDTTVTFPRDGDQYKPPKSFISAVNKLTKQQLLTSQEIKLELMGKFEDLLNGDPEKAQLKALYVVVNGSKGPLGYQVVNSNPDGINFRGRDAWQPAGFATVEEALRFYSDASSIDQCIHLNFDYLNQVKDFAFCSFTWVLDTVRRVNDRQRDEEIKAYNLSFFRERGYYRIYPTRSQVTFVKLDKRNLATDVATFSTDELVPFSFGMDRDLMREYLKGFVDLCEWAHQTNSIVAASGFKMNGEFISEKSPIEDSDDFSFPEFYPWFKDDIGEYFREFMDSRAGVILAIGDPGTGKSTFIRTALRNTGIRALVVTKPEVFMSQQFLNAALGMIQTNQVDVIVVEDADMYLQKRTEGNHRMAELLNVTSGINTSKQIKFVFTTNLKSLSEVDEALLRPGRCFDYLRFRPLTVNQAKIARKRVGLPDMDFGKRQDMILAEALSDSAISEVNEGMIRPRFP